jgi:membrane protease YdiL (CAAX protease family)
VSQAEDAVNEIAPRPRFGKWLFGTFLILLSWFILGSLLTGLSTRLFSLDITALAASDEKSRELLATYAPWKAASAILISFLPLLLVPIVLHRYLLKARIRELFTRSDRSFIREVRVGALAMTILLLATGIPDFLLNNSDYQLTFDAGRFIPYLLIAATLIPMQTTAEEVFFRGWIQQRLEKPGRSIWLISLIGGGLFVLPHLGNPEVNGELFYAAIGYGATGFMLAWVTMRDRSIGVAVGAHAANNILAGLLASTSDSALPSASIWTTPAVAWIPAAIVSILIIPTFIWLTGRWNSKVAS